MSPSNKLWQAGSAAALHPAVEAYTVGDDHTLDQQLLGYDIQASKAHAAMLQSVGLLTSEECNKLLAALDELHDLWTAGKFAVQRQQEDGHTAIEAYLVDRLGSTGKKIHTARSRNDQAMVMMRLYLKDVLRQAGEGAAKVAVAFRATAKKAGMTPMPGYTHMQKAMPTTVATWLHAYADGFDDAARLVEVTLGIIDQNPLGSAAGFGISLPIDREHTTKSLGFAATQSNPMYCGLSRGLFELIAVQALNPIMMLAGKFANDMMLFTTEEFGFFGLPRQFTTGSSIMPHKQNYDLFEIMRGHAHSFGTFSHQLQALSGGTGSGYHRDLQLTKSAALRAFAITLQTLEVLELAVANLKINKNALQQSIGEDMKSVEKINTLVMQGIPFRDAYVQVKKSLG